ncbi:MAG: tetratricopeptide repeat protein [Rhodoferax sp.]|nr:tetratricopeptide repeat protein [Rhodoferax sp.]
MAGVVRRSMQMALDRHCVGRWQEAACLYQAVLAMQPGHPDANHNLGTLAMQAGNAAQAVCHFRAALAAQDRNWQYWISLVDALIQDLQHAAAAHTLELARRAGLAQAAVQELVDRLVQQGDVVAVRLNAPDPATTSSGTPPSDGAQGPSAAEVVGLATLLNQGQFEELASLSLTLTDRYPGNVLGWTMMAIALRNQGQIVAAIEPMRMVAEITPGDVDNLNKLGLALSDAGELIESEVYFRRAIAVNPSLTWGHSNLGMVLQRQGRLAQAEDCFRRCLAIDESFHVAHLNLSVVLDDMGQPEQALACVRRALQIRPDFAQAHNSLGYLLKDLGRIDEAEASIRRSLELDPYDAAAHSNLLFVLNYHPDKTAAEIFQAYREFDARLGLPHRAGWRPHGNVGAAGRRLRIGYVCAAFGRHSSRYFLEPLLAHHDHQRFEVFAYSELLSAEDDVTVRYRGYADHWVSTVGVGDDELAARIRSDGIDVLIDIAGQTRGNRLGVFARKPAPVSLHWLDFGYTTGLTAIDYYLTDELTAPVGSESLFSEKPWRLPVPALVYRPPEGMGEVTPLPVLKNGHVTFGSLTRSIRINHRTLQAWTEILKRVTGSRLIIDSANFRDPAAQEALAQRFAALGIERSRLEIGFHTPPWEVLGRIDVGLDCFPHNSGTTLFEMLYMGVPFASVAGRPSVGRLGGAILSGVGHPELVAKSEEEYVGLAVALACDQRRLEALRRGLRGQLESSPLMDEVRFSKHVETAYETMFKNWFLTHGQVAMGVAPEVSCGQSEPPLTTPDTELESVLRQSMDLALQQHRSGKLDVAEEMYRAILEVAPTHADANHNLAVIALETGHAGGSLLFFQQALGVEPENWQYWLSYFDALLQAGECFQAIQMLEQRRRRGLGAEVLAELVLRAVDAVHASIGEPTVTPLVKGAIVASRKHRQQKASSATGAPGGQIDRIEGLFKRDQLEQVVELARAMTLRYPQDPFGWKALGAALVNRGKIKDSLGPLMKALAIAPRDVGARSNLGFALLSSRRPVEGEVQLRVALRLQPTFASALINLGANLLAQHRYDEAGEFFRCGLEAEPTYGPAYNHMGQVLDEQGRLIESVAHYKKALEILTPTAAQNRLMLIHLAQAHQSLCMNYGKLADYTDVVAHADAAMKVLPDDAELWERRLYALSYHPDLSVDQIFAEFVRWGDRFAAPVTDFSNHDRTPGRRLRVGYVSPDFRRHTSRFYFWPLFSNHDHAKVELFAYSNVKFEDEHTDRFKTVFDHWRDIRDMSDAEAAACVQADGIDILVDGCNHMRDERLGVFALKPAPLQVTWLGAAWTTGLKAVDYVLFDPHIAPPQTIARESIVRLPHCFVPYEFMTQTEDAKPPPCLKNGYTTFGYSGRSERLNHRTFRVWGEILARLPTARLVLDFRNFSDPLNQIHFRTLMQQNGLDTTRVVMRNSSSIFEGLHDFDILLDCFPHSGGTMLLDALWMGVPALTLAGRPPLGRIGTTFMMNLDLPEWVAYSEAEYIDKACVFAQDQDGLAELRADLRGRMQNSPLMDGKGFARGVEWAYETMWARFCCGEAPSPLVVSSQPRGAQ